MSKPPKFQRAEPDARREHLMKAALRCLITDGHAGLSVRRIATEAGVSVGLVNHHFGSIEALIAQTYESLAEEIVQALRDCVEQAGSSACARLDAFLAGSFSSRVLDPDLLSAWIVFWSMSRHSAPIADTHGRTYGAYLQLLEDLLQALATEQGFALGQVRLAAIGLAAMLDGLWLEWCLKPDTFSPEDGLEICRRWILMLPHGAFA